MHPSPASRGLLRLCALGLLAACVAGFSPAQTALLASDPIEGLWTGTVTGPQGPTALTLKFARDAGGKFDVTVHLPRMHTYGYTFPSSATAEAGTYSFAPLSTQLKLTGDQLTGTFGLGRLPVVLHRGGEFTSEPPAPVYPAAPAPLWSRNLGSLTWASPVVRDDTIYVGTRDGKFHAARAADGGEVWTWTGPNRIDGRAVVTADSVYFVDGKIELVALNRADGALRWRFPLHDEKLAGKPAPDNPTFNRRAAIPLVAGETVYCGSSDGGLYAVATATGQKLWRHDARSPVFSGIAQFDTSTLAFGTMDGSVVLLDPHTQKETGRMKTGGGVVTTPLLVNGKVIVGSRDYMLYGFNRADGSVAWKFSYWFSWVESTPQLYDGIIYVGASDYRRITAFDPATGRELWGTDVRGMCWGWPLVTTDTVFTGTASQNIPGTVIKHTGGIMALERKTGAVKWQYLAPLPPENSFGGNAGSLALAGDKLVAIGFDGVLTAWPAK